jgi:hypothetical protein
MSPTEATITIRTDGDAGDTVLELYEDGAASNPVVSPSTNVWADDHHGPGLRFSQITYVVQANTMYWIRVSGKPNIPTPNYTLSVLSGPIAPDLVVTDIWTVPANPITTEDVVIYVEVENIGYETVVVRPLVRLVCLPVGAADIGFNERFAYTADANIWPGHTTTAEFHFNTLPEGGHDIHAPSYSEMRATVDYDDQVSEMDETNNTGPLHQELLPFPYYYMP